MNTGSADIAEYAAIAALVQHYIDGARTGSGATMKKAFRDEAWIMGAMADAPFIAPIQELFDRVDKRGAAPELKAHIASIDIAQTAATVRLELDQWSGRRFTDLFTLVKVDGTWKIANKVFYLHGT